MASLALIIARTVTCPLMATVVAAAAGITSGVLLLSTRKAYARLSQVDSQLTELRDEFECRWTTHRLWTTNRQQARAVFEQTPET